MGDTSGVGKLPTSSLAYKKRALPIRYHELVTRPLERLARLHDALQYVGSDVGSLGDVLEVLQKEGDVFCVNISHTVFPPPLVQCRTVMLAT